MKFGKQSGSWLLTIVLTAQLWAAPPQSLWAQSLAPASRTTATFSAPAQEPENLSLLKTKLKHYHDCCYAAALEKQDKVALAYLERAAAHAKPGEKLALVLDIDETSLSNYQEEAADDFGFIPRDWNAWAESARAPAIPGTLKLTQRAHELGVAVFFITGRSEDQREATAKNLTSAGYADWAGLTLRTHDQAHEATIPYKSSARAAIVKQGYRIILNVGDQWSDLRGAPLAEYSVKLPNPFYYIP
jgi:acid phosphatase